MKNKVLAIVAMVMMVGLSVQAVLQYEVISTQPTGQGWKPAQQLTFKVTGGGSMWMTTYVSNWYGNLTHLEQTANMATGKYGWIETNDSAMMGTIHAAPGDTKEVTFTNGTKNISTTAYFLGNFEPGDEIGVWLTNMTEGEADQVGYSVGPVQQGENTELVSRQYNTTDQLGQNRINFGFASPGDSVEFLLFGDEYHGGGAVGQPLPGAFATLLLAGGVGTALTRKNRKREEE